MRTNNTTDLSLLMLGALSLGPDELKWMVNDILNIDEERVTYPDFHEDFDVDIDDVELMIDRKTYRGTCEQIMYDMYYEYSDKVHAWEETQ